MLLDYTYYDDVILHVEAMSGKIMIILNFGREWIKNIF
jgi:hypothetical protein